MTCEGRRELSCDTDQDEPEPWRIFASNDENLRCIKTLRENVRFLVPGVGKVARIFDQAKRA
jgi:hypothetical protein